MYSLQEKILMYEVRKPSTNHYLVIAALFVVPVVGHMIAKPFQNTEVSFVAPAVTAMQRNDGGIKQYEFTDLYNRGETFSILAEKNYYTVVELYLDSCSICKRLESDFPAFLNHRRDVVIRKVRFPEAGISQSFPGPSQAEVTQQIAEHFRRLALYNMNHVVKTDSEYLLSSCGTPHIEIYGPDKQLIVTDRCGDKNYKGGLAFLRKWIKVEKI